MRDEHKLTQAEILSPKLETLLDNLTEKDYECLSLLAEVETYRREPLELVKSGKLMISPKAGEIIPFIPNKAQMLMISKVQKCLDEKRPVRIRILKARQLGFSTLIEAIIYAFTSRREGFNSLVIADDDKGSRKLFEMNKLYHERLEDGLKPKLKRSNEIALEFEGLRSRIDIDTSRNKNAGRGDTYQIIHKSESSRFAYPKEVNLGIANSVPDLPCTMVFDESTANGMNNFYDDCMKSIRSEDGYELLFVPWYYDDTYSMPAVDFVRTQDEVDIAAQVVKDSGIMLTDQQLSWRRYAITHKCGGSLDLFKQEYPTTVYEAFISSGRPRFDVNLLRKLMDNAKEPHRYGLLDVFEYPDPLANYVIGVDTSEGLLHGDNSVVSVINCKTYAEDAIYCGKLAPDVLGEWVMKWGEMYNQALVVVEDNNHGLVTLGAMKGRYKNLYHRKTKDELVDGRTEKLGWRTTVRSKPILIGNVDASLRAGLTLRHKSTIEEFIWYVINDDGTTSAPEGKTDDRVMATACAVQGYIESKHERPIVVAPPERKSYKWWAKLAQTRGLDEI